MTQNSEKQDSEKQHSGESAPADSSQPSPDETAPAQTAPADWPAPDDFIQGPALPRPDHWERPGLVMFFNLECPSCISRGIPFLKRLHAEFGTRAHLMALHTSRGHRLLPRQDVEPQLTRFVRQYAKLPFPVALDLSGELARFYRTEGTPHTLVFAAGGELLRSVYGSQENAQTRLSYLLEELAGT